MGFQVYAVSTAVPFARRMRLAGHCVIVCFRFQVYDIVMWKYIPILDHTEQHLILNRGIVGWTYWKRFTNGEV